MRASVAAHRVGARARRRTGDATAKSSATFSPETAVKCARPEARNASIVAGGWPRSSPMTKPRYRLRSTGIHRPRAAFEQLAHPVGGVGQRGAVTHELQSAGLEDRDDVAAAQPAGDGPARRDDPALDRQLLAGQSGSETSSGPAEGPQLEVAPARDDVGHHAGAQGAGVGAQGHDAGERTGPHGRRARPRVRGEGAGQHEAAGDQRQRPNPAARRRAPPPRPRSLPPARAWAPPATHPRPWPGPTP